MSLHLNLDDAWDPQRVGMPTFNARSWGPPLRYMAPRRLIDRAMAELHDALKDERFILYGSGDFHHLAARWLNRAITLTHARDVTLISFDNHPDWDIRPPAWACGGWINRALELPPQQLRAAAVWGCGNFELAFPSRLFRNRRALAAGRLQIHAWAERQSPATARRFNCMTRATWRNRFSDFAAALSGLPAYITIDLDCLSAASAATNWENGLFETPDLVWALGELRHAGVQIIGADCCGAWSKPAYARPLQRLAAQFDHPRITPPASSDAQDKNATALSHIWPALTK